MIPDAVLATVMHLSAITSKAAVSPMPAFTACVAERESHGNPRARNPHSSAQGKYQFLAPWRHGLPFMVQARLVRFGMPKREAARIRVTLTRKPIAKWSEVLQDVAHAEVLSHPHGWRHWYLAGSSCNRLAVA